MTDKTEERLLKENVEKLKELVLREVEKEIDPKNKEFKKAMTNVIDRIIKMPKSPPIQHFEYKEDITIIDFVDWFDKTELYYNIGRDYIEEKEGSCCCVDKAFKRYLRPECEKVFNIISKQAERQTKAECRKEELEFLKNVHIQLWYYFENGELKILQRELEKKFKELQKADEMFNEEEKK